MHTDLQKRQTDIIAICDEMRQDSADNHGLHPTNYDPEDLNDTVRNCVGFKLTEREHRLAVVAFEEGADIAKESIWYEKPSKPNKYWPRNRQKAQEDIRYYNG